MIAQAALSPSRAVSKARASNALGAGFGRNRQGGFFCSEYSEDVAVDRVRAIAP